MTTTAHVAVDKFPTEIGQAGTAWSRYPGLCLTQNLQQHFPLRGQDQNRVPRIL